MKTPDPQRRSVELDRNYDAFVRMLAGLLPERRDQPALMRGGEIVDFFAPPGEANRAGSERYADGVYSIR